MVKKVLFVCVHNAARSQMAEVFLNDFGNGVFYAESAGLEPGKINPYVIDVMKEIGYDLSKKETNSVFQFFQEGRKYSYVVKVCDQSSGQRCPIFPQTLKVLDWDLGDPAEFQGSEEEIKNQVRFIRDEIKDLVLEFIKKYGNQ